MKRPRSDEEIDTALTKRIRATPQPSASLGPADIEPFLTKFLEKWEEDCSQEIDWSMTTNGSEFDTLFQLLSHSDTKIVDKALACLDFVAYWLYLGWERQTKDLDLEKRDLYDVVHSKFIQQLQPLLTLLVPTQSNSDRNTVILAILNHVSDLAKVVSDTQIEDLVKFLDEEQYDPMIETCFLLSRHDFVQDPNRRKHILSLCQANLSLLLKSQNDNIVCFGFLTLFRLMEFPDFWAMFEQWAKVESLDRLENLLQHREDCSCYRNRNLSLLVPLSDLRGLQFLTKLLDLDNPKINEWISNAYRKTVTAILGDNYVEPIEPVLSICETDWLWQSIGSNPKNSLFLSLCYTFLNNNITPKTKERIHKRTSFILNHIESLFPSELSDDGYEEIISSFVGVMGVHLCDRTLLPLLVQKCPKRIHTSLLETLTEIVLNQKMKDFYLRTPILIDFPCNIILESDDPVHLSLAASLLSRAFKGQPALVHEDTKTRILEKAIASIPVSNQKLRWIFDLISLFEGETSELWNKFLDSTDHPFRGVVFFKYALRKFSPERATALYKSNNILELICNECSQDADEDNAIEAIDVLGSFFQFMWASEQSNDEKNIIRTTCIPRLMKIISSETKPLRLKKYALIPLMALMWRYQSLHSSNILMENGGLDPLVALIRQADLTTKKNTKSLLHVFQILGGMWAVDPNQHKAIGSIFIEKIIFERLIFVAEEEQHYLCWFLAMLLKNNHVRTQRHVPQCLEKIVPILMETLTSLCEEKESSSWAYPMNDTYGTCAAENVLHLFHHIGPENYLTLARHKLVPTLTQMFVDHSFTRNKICQMITGYKHYSFMWEAFRTYPKFIQALSKSRTSFSAGLWGRMLKKNVALNHYQAIAYGSNSEDAWLCLAVVSGENMRTTLHPAIMQDIQTNLLKFLSTGPKQNFANYIFSLAFPIFAGTISTEAAEPTLPISIIGSTTQFKSCSEMSRHNDVVLSVGTKLIPCHKLILCHGSDFFNNLFNSKMKETLSSEPVIINEEDSESFEKMIQFLYVQKLEIQSFQEILTLFELAHMYCITTLLSALIQGILDTISVEHFFAVFEMSIVLSITELTQRLVSWLFTRYGRFSAKQIEELEPLRKKIAESFVGWQQLIPLGNNQPKI